MLRHPDAPTGAVNYYFYKWRDDGTDQTIHDLLRYQVREKRGPPTRPSGYQLTSTGLFESPGFGITT
ncbi:hypothetical protein [Streptacidiphilus sp. EB129]|uniref:hypothetical protein n=1 Tax=Streptacidiphilus sp. EB129 TaxID=3156262 RepID=UPI003518B408